MDRAKVFDEARRLHQASMTMKDIASELGVSYRTVRDAVAGVRRQPATKSLEDLKTREHVKLRLIVERGHSCEGCGAAEWLKQPVPLEIHRINTDEPYTQRDNVQLLCPNCHALTPNYRGRGIRRVIVDGSARLGGHSASTRAS